MPSVFLSVFLLPGFFPDGSMCLCCHLCVFNSNKNASSKSYCCRLFAQTLRLLCQFAVYMDTVAGTDAAEL